MIVRRAELVEPLAVTRSSGARADKLTLAALEGTASL